MRRGVGRWMLVKKKERKKERKVYERKKGI